MKDVTTTDPLLADFISFLAELSGSMPTSDCLPPSLSSYHTPFRGDFFKLFVDLKAIYEGVASDAHIFYVKMVKERFGFDLVSFYSSHLTLCEKICISVETKKSYEVLVDAYSKSVDVESSGAIPQRDMDIIDEATRHPLGIEAIGIYFLDQTNILLREAYTLLQERTINAPFFGRQPHHRSGLP